MDKKWLLAQLYANQNKNFVKRILNPFQYPTLDLGNGNYATHLMAWGMMVKEITMYILQ